MIVQSVHKFVAYLPTKKVDIKPFIDKENNRGIFVYEFSTIVFWNFTDIEVKAVINAIDFKPLQSEDFIMEIVDKKRIKPYVGDNKLVVNTFTQERVEVVARTIAQSVTLEHFEKTVDGLFDKIENIPTSILPSKQPYIYIKEIRTIRNNIIRVLKLLEKPDSLWSDPNFDKLYAGLRSVFELPERLNTIRGKLSDLKDDVLTESTFQDRKITLLLDILIVILIAMEFVIPFIR